MNSQLQTHVVAMLPPPDILRPKARTTSSKESQTQALCFGSKCVTLGQGGFKPKFTSIHSHMNIPLRMNVTARKVTNYQTKNKALSASHPCPPHSPGFFSGSPGRLVPRVEEAHPLPRLLEVAHGSAAPSVVHPCEHHSIFSPSQGHHSSRDSTLRCWG